MCTTNIFIFVVSRWPRRPRNRKHARAGSKIWNRGAFSAHVGVSRPTRSARIPTRFIRTIFAPACTRRAAKHSTRSGNALFDPTLAGAIAIMAVVKKLAQESAPNQSARGIDRRAESIGALNHGVNILKSRRRVWNLRRGRRRAIGLPVSAASRDDRLQALPQLTPPERLGQAVLDTEVLDLVLPKDESRLNDDGRRDAGRAQLV